MCSVSSRPAFQRNLSESSGTHQLLVDRQPFRCKLLIETHRDTSRVCKSQLVMGAPAVCTTAAHVTMGARGGCTPPNCACAPLGIRWVGSLPTFGLIWLFILGARCLWTVRKILSFAWTKNNWLVQLYVITLTLQCTAVLVQ